MTWKKGLKTLAMNRGCTSMIERLIETSLNNRFLVFILTALVAH